MEWLEARADQGPDPVKQQTEKFGPDDTRRLIRLHDLIIES